MFQKVILVYENCVAFSSAIAREITPSDTYIGFITEGIIKWIGLDFVFFIVIYILMRLYNKYISSKIKIKNPAFEFVDKKYIHSIISEYGILKYRDFLKKAGKW